MPVSDRTSGRFHEDESKSACIVSIHLFAQSLDQDTHKVQPEHSQSTVQSRHEDLPSSHFPSYLPAGPIGRCWIVLIRSKGRELNSLAPISRLRSQLKAYHHNPAEISKTRPQLWPSEIAPERCVMACSAENKHRQQCPPSRSRVLKTNFTATVAVRCGQTSAIGNMHAHVTRQDTENSHLSNRPALQHLHGPLLGHLILWVEPR
ncbi:hypothetical protein AcV5_003641 [Taiwanofungus camphoratus]|nr:hypothetical protein AcV5_003641 [Antrodia cinnamomea]